ncbi:MAG: hypothetical protein Q7U20_07800 [Caulobacter sp.]|nr:hypothetical protein [Caulobacter sp.]
MSHDFDEMFQRANGTWTQRVSDPRPNAPEGEQAAGSGLYKPYGYTPADDLETCEIAWWLPDGTIQGQEVQYRFLIRLHYVGNDQLTLFLTDCVITLEGRNLRDLRKRLARRRVTFIQAFHPKVWPNPPEGDPLIARIGVLYPGEEPGGKGRQ